LQAYDWLMRLHRTTAAPSAKFLLVLLDEKDIRAFDQYPVSDEDLAKVIQSIESHQPRVIGVDIYRDIYVPSLAKTTIAKTPIADPDVLQRVIGEKRNTVWAMKATGDEDEAERGVRPPKVLALFIHPGTSITTRLGFTDVPQDKDGVVRRGILRQNFREQNVLSLDLATALRYLRAANPKMELNPAPPDVILGSADLKKLDPDGGGYVDLQTAGFQQYLDSRRDVRFPQISFHQAMDPGNPLTDDQIKDAIVLLGVHAASVPDAINTSIGNSEAGLMIHARMIDQLIRQANGEKPISVWPRTQIPLIKKQIWLPLLDLGWWLLWALLGGCVGFAVRSPWKAGGILLCGLFGLVAIAGWELSHAAVWIPLVPPAICWIVSAAVVTAYVSYREKADRKAWKQLFEQHQSKTISDKIWKERKIIFKSGRLVPQKLEATVLFTDLKGFSTLTKDMEPTKVLEFINLYMERMSTAIEERGGVINKYIGDSIMAIFGVPVPRSDAEISQDARQAVLAALDLRRELSELNADWKSDGLPEVCMRVGIFTGPLVAGSVGSTRRMEYTVLGNTVNAASRLESHDKEEMSPDIAACGCRIMIGALTQELVINQFQVRAFTVDLKGIGEQQIYGVIGPATATAQRPVDDPTIAAPLYQDSEKAANQT